MGLKAIKILQPLKKNFFFKFLNLQKGCFINKIKFSPRDVLSTLKLFFFVYSVKYVNNYF